MTFPGFSMTVGYLLLALYIASAQNFVKTMLRFCAVTFCNCFYYCALGMQSTFNVIMKIPRRLDICYPFGIRPEETQLLLPPIRRLRWPTDLVSDFRHALDQNPHS